MSASVLTPTMRGCNTASSSPRCQQQAQVHYRGSASSNRYQRTYSGRASTKSFARQARCLAAQPRQNSVLGALVAPLKQMKDDFTATLRQSGGSNQHYDILGLGQAMCDYSVSIDDCLLAEVEVDKGGRRVVSVEERAVVMETLDEAGCESQVSPGGSLANTLVGISRLSKGSSKPLRVAMAGSMGVDTLGQYFNAQMSSSGVSILLDEHAGHTGTVISLTTPDAQRSFVSFFTSGEMRLSEAVKKAIRSSRVLVIEGYLWETPNALEYIRAAAALARDSGAQVVLTAGDPGVVQRHKQSMMTVIQDGVDMVFTNVDEALNLLQDSDDEASQLDGRQAALKLGTTCSIAVVTDGSKGAYITAMGQLHVIPPHWTPQGPVDTCGAGDAFAAGVLFSLLSGYDCRNAGLFGARVASAVISRFGPQLSLDDAMWLSAALPEHSAPSEDKFNWMRASFDGYSA